MCRLLRSRFSGRTWVHEPGHTRTRPAPPCAMRLAKNRRLFVGGSIGAVVTMAKYLKAPIVFLGLSLPEHGYHAPNENFDWEQASGGMRMFARYFETLARLPLRASHS